MCGTSFSETLIHQKCSGSLESLRFYFTEASMGLDPPLEGRVNIYQMLIHIILFWYDPHTQYHWLSMIGKLR